MTLTAYGERIEACVGVLRERFGDAPTTAVVLGSGLGAFAEGLAEAESCPASELPHWPVSTAPGHRGRLVVGFCGQRRIAVMQGRVHYYETGDMTQVVFPPLALCRWGVKNLVLTNAAGAVDLSFEPGDLVAIEDHINFMGANPLVEGRTGFERYYFPDMTTTYSSTLLQQLERASRESEVVLRRGIYMAFSGPSYETPAEIRMARTLGVHMVGMSTVPEAIAARTMGAKICCISCVSNMAAGITGNLLTEEEVLSTMAASGDRLGRLLTALVRQI